MTDTRTFLYHPHGKPIPEGWKLASTLSDCYHGNFSVLIEEVMPEGEIVVDTGASQC